MSNESFEESVIEQVTEAHITTPEIKEQPLTEEPGHSPTPPDNWKGDRRYFQTGKKAGQLKPSANKEAEPEPSAGLDFDLLRPTETAQPQKDATPAAPDKKALKAEKKLVEAKIAAKLVMRVLDTLVMWISAGSYGKEFTADERNARNKYRDELETDWQDYLVTLDIPLHPALVCIAGSVFYVTPALATPKGEARVASFKERIFGKIGMAMFSRGKK